MLSSGVQQTVTSSAAQSPECSITHLTIRPDQTTSGRSSADRNSSPSVVRWSSVERNNSATPSDSVQVRPLEVRYGTDSQGRMYTEHGHKMVVDGDAYTLLILDCSPQPPDGGDFSCDCHRNCSCQTELIVRQQVIPHDHVCQHVCHQQRQQQQQQMLSIEHSSSQQLQRQHLEDSNILDVSRRSNSQQQYQQQQQQETLYARREQPTTNSWETTSFSQQRESPQTNQTNSRQVVQDTKLSQQPHYADHQDQWNWRQEDHSSYQQQTRYSEQHELSSGQQPAQPQPQPQQQPQSSQQPWRPKPGNKLVKRWNWNQQQFVLSEEPDRPVARPLPAPAAGSSSGRPTDVWNQDLLGIANESPVPVKSYDPSWLAYRVPDMDSVQSDPLYRDLMMELQRLEEGVGAKPETPLIEPETVQKPVIGQRIMPESLEVDEYENAEFVCRIIPTSDPTMRVEWSVNGRPLQESSRYTNEFEFGVARLRIRRCEAEDSGVYKCRAVNSLGEAISTASLRVHAKGSIQYETLNPAGLDKIRQLENPKSVAQVEQRPAEQPPRFVTHIADYVEKAEGDSVHFECCLGPVDDPELRTEWFFNGRPLVTGSRFHTIDDFGFVVLDIDWLFPRDTGEYVCRASNRHGSDITRTVLRVKPDRNIVLDSQLDDPATIDKLRQLEFPDVVQESALEEPDKPAHFVQQLRSEANRRQFVEGDNVHFEARVGPATDGSLTVEWLHNDKPLISGHRFKPTFDFGHILLDILYVYPEDSGVYKCVARNATGSDESQFEIRVTGKPSLVLQSQLPREMVGGVQKITEMEAMWNRAPDPEEDEAPAARRAPEFVLRPVACAAFEGSSARFCCRVEANPKARLTWTLNGQTVVSGSRHRLTYDGMYHLIIAKCQPSDAGKVEVHARNPLGECFCATELTVKRKLDDYRGVLKNSPNPWYDEATLKQYRRQRSIDMNDDDDDYFAFHSQRLRLAAEQQSHSPLGNQLVGYMEPGTPDVNLLARSVTPLVEPGDMHPVVAEQQAVMAPAPSTVQRALDAKDSIGPAEQTFQGAEQGAGPRRRLNLQVRDAQQAAQGGAASTGLRYEDLISPSISEQPLHLPTPSPIIQSQEQQAQLQRRVFGLNSTRTAPKVTSWSEQLANRSLTRSQHQSERDQSSRQEQRGEYLIEITTNKREDGEPTSSQQQQQQLVDLRVPPPPSPESVVHGKEVHSHTHKQTQLERRPNKEIVREIIEKEIFEQEHRGVTKDSALRGESSERGTTPVETLHQQQEASGRRQQQQQKQVRFQQDELELRQQEQQQQHVLIEDYMTPPEFVQKIQPIQAIDGDEARFECSFIGEPQPNISWYRESKLIKQSNLHRIVTDMREMSSTLIIKRVSLGGNAVYTVKAENAAGSAKSSANLVVEAHPLAVGAAKSGVALQMDSSAAASAGQTITSSSSSSSGTMTMTTTSSEVTSSSCSQQEGDQPKVVKSVRTRRLSPDEMSSLIRASPEGFMAPTFLHTIHDVSTRPGELARLDARLLATQPVEVRWTKDGERVRPDQCHKMLLEGDLYTLLILECSPRDEGVYECIATNPVGEARCGARLSLAEAGRGSSAGRLGSQTPDIQLLTTTHSRSQSPAEQRRHYGLTRHQHTNPMLQQYTPADCAGQSPEVPKLIKRLESQQVQEGKSVTLRCQISSFPRAEVSWYRQDDKLIKPSKYFRIFKDNDETYCLRILETFPEDQGEYRCVARAPNGYVETRATISVIPNSPR